jgi:hypothetical protein
MVKENTVPLTTGIAAVVPVEDAEKIVLAI